MHDWLADIIECTCMFFYAILVLRIGISLDVYFNTPFYTFFITTGVCGILSVVSFMTGTHVNFTEPWAWIFKVCWIVNHVGAIGSLLGKLIISYNRYSVLRSSDLVENKWKRSFVYRLVAIQFLIPCATAIKVLFYDYKYEMRDGVQVVYTYTDTGIVGKAKAQILRHQKTMFIIVLICVISHFVKAVHQAIWGATTLLGHPELADAIYAYYSYVNGLATYAAPVVLVVCSSRVRHLFLPRHITYSMTTEAKSSALQTSSNKVHPT